MSKGLIAVIGDSHIGLGEGAETRMIEWLDRLEAHEPLALYLNGDVFHYFVGNRKFIAPSVMRFFDRLRRLRDSGIDVYYVEGNRDFFLEGSIAEESVTEITMECAIKAGEKNFLIVHGDMINDRDYPYRLWRQASKNPLTRLGVKLWPERYARRFVDGVEEKLSRTNFKHKYRLPTELMKRYAHRRATEGHDVVVFGHFHQKLELLNGGSTVIILPAWCDTEEAMMIDPDTGDWEFVRV